MKFNDDYYEYERESKHENGGSNITFIYMALIMSTVVLGVTALVFFINKPSSGSSGSGYAAAVAQRDERLNQEGSTQKKDTMNGLISDSNLTSDELDIWTLPDTGREKNNKASGNGTVTNQTTGETITDGSSTNKDATTADELVDGKTYVYDVTDKEKLDNEKLDKDTSNDKESKNDEESEKDKDDEKGGRTQIVRADGTKEWVDIDEDIDKNDYDFSNLKYKAPVMEYSADGKTASWFGVDISANQGNVDFSKLKNAGCNYCMIKVGARGYASGKIVMDEKFEENLEAAEKAKLNIGVYFCSQAVTKDEVREEAEVLLDAIEGFDIKYPVVFVMENIEDDMARIEALDIRDRTNFAKIFMDEVEDAGYTPMLYGNKEWLITMLDLKSFADREIWLAQNGDKPDYPYEFSMWQYETEGSVKGIEGDVALSISFKDYSKKN